jgi:hypothetical protein
MRTVIDGFGPCQGLLGLDDGALYEPAAAIVTGAGHSQAQLLIGSYPGFRVLALGDPSLGAYSNFSPLTMQQAFEPWKSLFTANVNSPTADANPDNPGRAMWLMGSMQLTN